MRIAYIILAHKLPEQLVRLVRKLDTGTGWFLIHVDKQTDHATYRKMREPLGALQNVHFLERHACHYGDYSILEATLKGIRKIWALGLPFDYVVTLSGQDYPIKSTNHIQDFFEERKGQSFLEYFSLPDDHWKSENGGLDRVVYWHFFWRGQNYSLRKDSRFVAPLATLLGPTLTSMLPLERKIPGNLKPFGGPAQWNLSRDCVEYLVETMQCDKALMQFFKHVSTSIEVFYQTVLLNSPLKNHIVNDDLHYIKWPPVDSPHPLILRKQDFAQFSRMDKLFARKFDATVDADVLDMIDQVTS